MFDFSDKEIIGWALGIIGIVIFLGYFIKEGGLWDTIVVLFQTAVTIIWICVSLYLIMGG